MSTPTPAPPPTPPRVLVALVVVAVIVGDYATVFPPGIREQWLRLLLVVGVAWGLHQWLGPAAIPLGLGRVRASLRTVGRVLLVGTGVYLVGAAGVLLATHLGGLRWDLRPANFQHQDQYWAWFWLAVVWAPLIEEVVYRGIVQARVRQLGGPWLAIAVSGLSFWAYHWVSFGHVTSPHHLGAGLLLAWSYERTRSLLAPVVLHAIGNLVLGTSDLVYVMHPQWVHWILGWS